MGWSAVAGFVWIILVSLVALMPFPRHKPYALAMLALFPVLLVLVALDYGVLWAAVFFLGALSIYRYPALYYIKRLRARMRVLTRGRE